MADDWQVVARRVTPKPSMVRSHSAASLRPPSRSATPKSRPATPKPVAPVAAPTAEIMALPRPKKPLRQRLVPSSVPRLAPFDPVAKRDASYLAAMREGDGLTAHEMGTVLQQMNVANVPMSEAMFDFFCDGYAAKVGLPASLACLQKAGIELTGWMPMMAVRAMQQHDMPNQALYLCERVLAQMPACMQVYQELWVTRLSLLRGQDPDTFDQCRKDLPPFDKDNPLHARWMQVLAD